MLWLWDKVKDYYFKNRRAMWLLNVRVISQRIRNYSCHVFHWDPVPSPGSVTTLRAASWIELRSGTLLLDSLIPQFFDSSNLQVYFLVLIWPFLSNSVCNNNASIKCSFLLLLVVIILVWIIYFDSIQILTF